MKHHDATSFYNRPQQTLRNGVRLESRPANDGVVRMDPSQRITQNVGRLKTTNARWLAESVTGKFGAFGSERYQEVNRPINFQHMVGTPSVSTAKSLPLTLRISNPCLLDRCLKNLASKGNLLYHPTNTKTMTGHL